MRRAAFLLLIGLAGSLWLLFGQPEALEQEAAPAEALVLPQDAATTADSKPGEASAARLVEQSRTEQPPTATIRLRAVNYHYPEKSETPVADVRLRYGYCAALSHHHYSKRPLGLAVLGSATTGSEGVVEVPLPPLPSDFSAEDPLYFWAEFDQPEFQRRPAWFLMDADPPRELKLRAYRGTTLEGRVLDAAGRPVSSGKVNLLRHDEEKGLRTWEHDDLAVDGSFRINLRESGTGHLLARCESVGTAALGPLELDIEKPNEPFEMVRVRAISGRVVDPSGNPLPDFDVRAHPIEYPDEARWGPSPVASWPYELEGRGCFSAWQATSTDGGFAFTGLRPGQFLLFGRDGSSGDFNLLLTDGSVRTGTQDLELAVSAYRLEVVVRDQNGALRPASWQTRPEWAFPDDGSVEVAVRLVPLVEGEPTYRSLDTQIEKRSDGGLRLYTSAGSEFLLTAISADAPSVEEKVRIEAGEHLRQVEFIVPRGPASGLVVRPLLSDRRPFRGRCRLQVLPAEGLEVPLVRSFARGWFEDLELPWKAALGPGNYRLRLLYLPRFGHHGERFDDEAYLPVTLAFEIRPGETTELEPVFRAGGRLVLSLSAQGEPDLQAWPAQDIPLTGSDRWESLARGMGMASVAVTGPDGGQWFPSFDSDIGNSVGLSANYETSWITIGQTRQNHDLLPPGECRLRVQAPGYPPLEQTVWMEAGKETVVNVLLKSERETD